MPGDRDWVVGERISHIHPIMYLVQYTSYSVHRTVSRVHCTFSKQYSVRSTPIKKHVEHTVCEYYVIWRDFSTSNRTSGYII